MLRTVAIRRPLSSVFLTVDEPASAINVPASTRFQVGIER